jgi:hypothetical protein
MVSGRYIPIALACSYGIGIVSKFPRKEITGILDVAPCMRNCPSVSTLFGGFGTVIADTPHAVAQNGL